MRLSEYAEVIDGELIQDGLFDTLEYCTAQCEKTFLTFLENSKYLSNINSKVSCIIIKKELLSQIPQFIQGIIVTEEPKKSFVELHNYLAGIEGYRRPSFKSKIGKNCQISPLAYVSDKNVILGDNVVIEPFAVIKENVTIGNNCVIHENSVIGGKGFNFTRTQDNDMIGMYDLGQVILEDGVEIFSNSHIANGPLPTDKTILGKNVKVDVMVHIGHGAKIGERTLIPAGALIGGNVVIGKNSWIGLNATISNRINIGEGGRVSLGAVVTKNVDAGQTVSGNFAIPHKDFIEQIRQKRKLTSEDKN